MLPPGSPPSALSSGSICRHWYAGPPAARIASVSRVSVTSAATTPSLVGPVLSWTSSSATRSGLAMPVTICPASASNLAGGSPGSRFSTLKVPTASSYDRCARVRSRGNCPLATVGVAVTSSL